MLSYADKVKKKKKKSSSFADSVINGTYETAFSKNNVSTSLKKTNKSVTNAYNQSTKPSNNLNKLQTTTLLGNSQFQTQNVSRKLLGEDNIPFKSTLTYTPKDDDIAPVKDTTKEKKAITLSPTAGQVNEEGYKDTYKYHQDKE